MTRRDVLDQLADRIAALRRPHPVRVAVDGVDAAGKTTLADELGPLLISRGRPVIRASIDGFHRPRAERYLRGPDSPEGYFLDSFDYVGLRDALLRPLGPGGRRRYRRAIFDYRADAPLLAPEETAPADAVLLFDGVFLLGPELDGEWDYRVFVDVSTAIAVRRGVHRDEALFGSRETAEARYLRRYAPGQRLYLDAARPRERAQAIVHNDDPRRPAVEFRP